MDEQEKLNTCLPLTPLRSKTDPFSYKEHCLYCGHYVINNGRKRQCDVWSVRTLEPTILNTCLQRNDVWSDTVRARIEQVNDLPAADALYHQTCSSNFRTGKDIPEEFQVQPSSDKKRRNGRPEDTEASDAFLKVMTFFKDNDDEQVTINNCKIKW
ncbi:hypothetical protein DPMN_020320 [Dreissena polymorpha]|uniref:Uncharacterized protein n=1 Tax=Dreissena polymorpha TaxID=45954 RepID=A0A9D4SAY2_DREPO|nr:hypothetical protein DPMN_020320 [Dreissena polymorpha]